MFILGEEVATALRERRPLVALETSVVAQGLPPPLNLESARRCAAAVRSHRAVPAAVAVIGGKIIVGASDADLQRLADPARRPLKAGARDLAAVCARKLDAGTTVSATCMVAERIGIRIFATGGIGGVHRRFDGLQALDVSSDLAEIARRRLCVVCAGPKAILDVRATSEMLESLGVPVWGFQTGELPAFFTDASGVALEHRFEDAAGVAAALKTQWDVLEAPTGVVLGVPPPAPLPRAEIEDAIDEAVREAARRKLPGKEVTPFLLRSLAAATQGRSQTANVALLEKNSHLAAEISLAMA